VTAHEFKKSSAPQGRESQSKGLYTVQNVWVLQHTSCENLGSIEDVLRAHQIGFQYIQTHVGEPVPREIADNAGLIVMGGPMGVYEQAAYPFLRDEMRLIESALVLGRPVLGICLGSQLLAATLGAEVTKGQKKELGWHEVTLSKSASDDALFKGVAPKFWPFHWHGDIFPLPKDSVSLASSELTNCQAFRHGANAYGLLFHLEVTEPQIGRMLIDFADELRQAGGRPSQINEETPRRLPAVQAIARDVFSRWASLVVSG
jgi:GMP synthase (glutamine-hydrolysing)